MRKNLLIIGLAGVLGMSIGLSSCAPDYETDFSTLSLAIPDESQAPITLPLSGGTQEIQVETNVPYDNWTATSNAEWCKLDKQENKVVVSADKNDIYKQRIAQITIAYGHQSYAINVTQFGLEPVIKIEGLDKNEMKVVDPKATSLDLKVMTNLDMNTITVPDTCNWVRFEESQQPKASSRANEIERHLVFSLDQNTDTVVRYCTIILQSSDNYSCASTFIIKQQKRGYIIEADDAVKKFDMEDSGGIITIPFKINGPKDAAYTYTIEESAKSWITPMAKTRGMREDFEKFTIQPNIIEEPRVGHITFTSTDKNESNSFTVTVNQAAFIPVPPFNVVNATATAGAGIITLNWNIPEKKNYTKMVISYSDPIRHETIKKEINDNSLTSYAIDGTYKCGGTYKFTIKTYGPTGMETEQPVTVNGTSLESPGVKTRIALTKDMLYANATRDDDGGGIPALIDDNKDTYYHSMWGAATDAAHYIQISLEESVGTVRFEYDARNNLANNAGDVKRAGIWGSDTGADDNSWVKLGTENFVLPTSKGGHSVPDINIIFPKEYKYIRFIPEARRSIDPLNHTNGDDGWWNMANLYFYEMRHDEAWARKYIGL